ncbi:MAG: hypothetical protein UHM08_08925 [Bacteroidales bacterium]|nr:hypothetical protein [Bacteroidales bacterium]
MATKYYTYNQILSKARELKKGVETEKKLTISPKWSYYFAQSIINPKKNITRIEAFDKAPKPHGNVFNKVKIYKADYIKCAKQLINFVNKNKMLRNYLNFGKYQIRTRDYAYNLAKILVWYADHNVLPAYNTIDSHVWDKTILKKYGHATKSGCDNRGQNNGYYCGCHALQEIFRNLTGIVVPQSTIAEWAGTTSDGTDHWGLETAVAQFNRKYGKKLKVNWYNFSEIGWSGLRRIIASKNQDFLTHVLYRLTWGHYEVINAIYDDYCDVQNSLGDYCDYGCYCGYVEERYLSTHQSYMNGISQKSVMVVTNEG